MKILFRERLANDLLNWARHKYRKRAQKGNPDRLFELARFYASYGRDSHAMECCLEACEKGHREAHNLRKFLHSILPYEGKNSLTDELIYKSKEYDVQEEYYTTKNFLLKKAESDDMQAKYKLANLYYKSIEYRGVYIRSDLNEAAKWWRAAADQGHIPSQLKLAFLYDSGKIGEHDEDKAIRWLRKAAERDHAGAQYMLGYIYEEQAWKCTNRNLKSESSEWPDVGGAEAQEKFGEAVKWLHKSAEQGYADAQKRLGQIYARPSASKNMVEAAKWYRRAAQQGKGYAQLRLAEMYLHGNGVSKSHAEAVRWYLAAAEHGVDDAYKTLGFMYASGDILPKDYHEAARWWQLAVEPERWGRYNYVPMWLPDYSAEAIAWLLGAAANGSNLAIEIVEWWCTTAHHQREKYLEQSAAGKNGWELDLDANLQHWLSISPFYFLFQSNSNFYESLNDQAVGGNLIAQLCLGFTLITSGGGSDKETEGVRWFHAAADQGSALAKRILGELYSHGKCSVALDSAKGEEFYALAAEQNDIEAQYKLGWSNHIKVEDKLGNQKNIERDSEGRRIAPEEYFEAAKWYLSAAEKGHAIAQYCLSNLYLEGRDVEKDSKDAMKWLMRSAENGYAAAQIALADAYNRGEILTKNAAEAERWYFKAAQQGSVEANEKNIRAMSKLAYMYFCGDEDRQDAAEAMKWARWARALKGI